MKCSGAGLALIREFEGCELEAYLCPAGVWTIGVGHTRAVKPGDRISDQEALDLLKQDVRDAEWCVDSAVTADLSQPRFDALVSFVFNLGCKAFRGSNLLALINGGDFHGAAQQFARWNKVGGEVSAGLVRRRKAEAEMFVS